MKDNDPSLQRVSPISFRNLVKTVKNENENLYQDSDVFNDDDRNVFFKFIRGFKKNFNIFYGRIKKQISLLRFAIDLLVYIIQRVRLISVVLSVVSEVFGIIFDGLKGILVKNMFWGRGNLFKYSFQLVSVFLAIIILISFSYSGNPVVGIGEQAFYGQDLLSQRSVTTVTNLSSLTTYDTQTYIVKSGDTLSRIAKSHRRSVDTIMWSNGLSENSILKPGMKLIIPPGDGVLVKATAGETLFSIAKKFKVNAQTLLDDNVFLISANDLKKGDVLFVRNAEPIVPIVPKPVYAGTIVSKRISIPSSGYVSSAGRFLSWPVSGGRGSVSQCYWSGHNGIDIWEASYPSLVAAAGGRVTFAGFDGSGLAWTVIIDHGNGFSTIYGHMNKIYVKNGQSVSRGQQIGQMGASGRATGVHVHFMLIQGGGWRWVNPAPYMTTHICGY